MRCFALFQDLIVHSPNIIVISGVRIKRNDNHRTFVYAETKFPACCIVNSKC